jgi:chorismate synthase
VQVTLRKVEIDGGLFQIVMAQQDLNGVQVGTRFQQVGGEAVAEHVGINFLFNAGTAGGVLAGVARGLGIDGLIAAVPAIAGK